MNNGAALSHLGFVECRECEHRYSPCTYTHAWIVAASPTSYGHSTAISTCTNVMVIIGTVYVMHYFQCIVDISQVIHTIKSTYVRMILLWWLCVYSWTGVCVVWACGLCYKIWFEFSLVGLALHKPMSPPRELLCKQKPHKICRVLNTLKLLWLCSVCCLCVCVSSRAVSCLAEPSPAPLRVIAHFRVCAFLTL